MQSTREILLGVAAAAALALGGCGEAADDGGTTGDTHEHAPGETHEHAEGETHEHAEGETHDGEEAAGGELAHDEAGRHDLGSATIGAYTVQAARYGEITPGEEGEVDITVSGEGSPAAVRAWIGVEDGSGSMKAKAESEGDHFHAHVEAPDPMPEGAMLWVEVESGAGETARGSFALE